MGCGISTLDIKDAPLNGHSNKGHQYAITQPVMENKKDFENGEEGDVVLLVEKNHNHNNYVVIMRPILGDEEVKTMKKDRSNEEMLKEKYIIEMNKEEEKALESGGKERCNGNDKYTKNVKNIEDGHEYQDGSFIGPSSPSFRDYCNEYYVSEARSSEENFNDYDFKESMKNNDDDNSSNRKNKPKNDGSVNSNKDPEKKERRGRGFKNIINKRKIKGRKNLLNFSCYHNNNDESHVEGSSKKIVGKTA